jgi:GAF domain-containing protein
MLRFLLQTAVDAIGGDEGSLLAYDPGANDLCFAMTVGNDEAESRLVGQRLPIGAGVTGLAAATRQVQVGAPVYHDIEQTKRKGADPEAVLAAPMVDDDRLIGVFTVVSFAAGRRFGAKEANIGGRLATVGTIVVQQHLKIAALGERSLLTLSGADPEVNARLDEIDASLKRIVAQWPETLAQISAMLASFEIVLGKTRK